MGARHWAIIAPFAALGGCADQPVDEIRHPRPQWGITIDGIAPLMTPTAVGAALDARGYRPVACASDEPVVATALEAGDDFACFEAPDRPFRVSLYFLDLREGRRLAVADFYEYRRSSEEFEQRAARGARFSRSLPAILGAPSRIEPLVLQHRIWEQPGGNPNLPDTVTAKSGRNQAPNLSMVSMWAYGERRVATTDPPPADPAQP